MIVWTAAALAATLELRVDGPATAAAERIVVVEGVWEPGETAPEALPAPSSSNTDDRWTAQPLRREQAGGRVRLTQPHMLAGAAGPRVIEPICADASLCSDALYLDLGPATPPAGMQDIVEPPPPPTPLPWGTIVTGLAALGAVLVAVRAWRAIPPKALPSTPSDPPDVVALRRWAALRADATLDDASRALALSELFRDYLAACLSLPARSLSTSEVLASLQARPALRDPHHRAAERLLRATDRVKYAEDRPGADKFAALDEDLRVFIDATRPLVEAPR